MKRYFKYVFAATILLWGFVSCSKNELQDTDYSLDDELYQVTIGAKIADETKTSMATNGDILWKEGDQISVKIGSNERTFTALSGGTTSAEFAGYVTADERKSLLDGTAFTATYPASGAVVPGEQTFVDGNFADNTFPMTGQGANSSVIFTNPAAVVMAQDVEIGDATSATLRYFVEESEETITLKDISSKDEKVDLLFVVKPGASSFSLSLGSSSETKEVCTSKNVEAGRRYLLYSPDAFVAEFNGARYLTLETAVQAAEQAGSGTIKFLSSYDRYPQAWLTSCVIDGPEISDAQEQSYYTFHAFNPTNGDEELALKWSTTPGGLTEEEQQRAQKVMGEVEPYFGWPCDFEVYFDSDVEGNCYNLAGNYYKFGWLSFDGQNLSVGDRVQLLHSVLGDGANQFNYQYMLEQVFQFHCGIASKDDTKMLGKTFSVELCMYHPQNPEIKILTSRTDYTFKPVAKIGDVSYGTLADALSALK